MTGRPLDGQRALVTGGTRGIGLAAAGALIALGARVTFTARSEESRARALSTLASDHATGVICDITDHARLQRVFSAPGFDILVNNAGVIAPIGRMAEVAPADFATGIATNLAAQFAAIHFALPYMLGRGRGTIVNLSSGAAHAPKEGWAAYCAGKAGLAMLTRALDLEYRAQGIRTFGIAPGVVDTGMQGEIRASGINPVSRLPRAALASPDGPGRAIAWLCTDAADHLIGQELDVRTPALRAEIGLTAID